MISIEFIEPQEPNKPQPPAFWQTNIRRCFLSWCDDYKPDTVSRLVLGSLVEKYVQGNEDALFGKMHQLVRDEHYKLCVIFKSMFDYMDINKGYLRWVSENNGSV